MKVNNTIKALMLSYSLLIPFRSVSEQEKYMTFDNYKNSWEDIFNTIQQVKDHNGLNSFLKRSEYDGNICEKDAYVGVLHGGRTVANNLLLNTLENGEIRPSTNEKVVTLGSCSDVRSGLLIDRYKSENKFPANYLFYYDEDRDLEDYSVEGLEELPYKILLISPAYCQSVGISIAGLDQLSYNLRFDFINFEKVKSNMEEKEEVVSAALVDISVYEEYCNQNQ